MFSMKCMHSKCDIHLMFEAVQDLFIQGDKLRHL